MSGIRTLRRVEQPFVSVCHISIDPSGRPRVSYKQKQQQNQVDRYGRHSEDIKRIEEDIKSSDIKRRKKEEEKRRICESSI